MKHRFLTLLVSLVASSLALTGIVGAQLGSVDKDLVYTPVAPCRIADTRVLGGFPALVANAERGIDVATVSSYTFQGGEATDCGIGGLGSFAAVAVNLTVINPNASGTLKAYAFNVTPPANAVAMTFAAGEVRSNFAIVKLDQSASANEMTLLSSAGAHVTIDVVGYFIQSPSTALQCIEMQSAGGNVTAGSFGTQSTPNCTAGYIITGGGCSMSTFDGRVVTSRMIVSGSSQTYFCAFRNEGASTIEGIAYSRCCRVPGRTP
jgi:hypothetical protein